MTYDVYGVGNALVDVQAQVADAMLARLKFPKGMMTLVDEPTQQRVLAELAGVPISRCAGGSAANTVLGVADLGGTAAYAGKTAGDELGAFFLDDMRRLGVAIEVPPADGHTGTCVILITQDAQRTMLTCLGVSATLGPDDIDEAEVRKARYVYVEGYLFAGSSTREAALRAM
ncbi:MAG: adenosine kinase, partial [Planctomycetaceae bacterium]